VIGAPLKGLGPHSDEFFMDGGVRTPSEQTKTVHGLPVTPFLDIRTPQLHRKRWMSATFASCPTDLAPIVARCCKNRLEADPRTPHIQSRTMPSSRAALVGGVDCSSH
jgi:hypothetical protein